MKHKQLTLSDRTDIQMGIEQRKPFSAIAAKLGKDPSTISKEVRRNLFIKETTVQSNCNTCPLLKKAPYVCNNCPRKRSDCGFKKQFYYAKKAQLNYETQLSEARTGVALNKEEFYTMDNIVSSAIKKGQHLNHIISSNNLTPSRASSYRYLEKGYLSARPIDFPRVVKFRKRRTSQLPPIPKKDKVGRTYEYFQKHQAKEDLTSWIEMDTVIGRIGGKVLLTFNVSLCNFIFARLLDNKTATEVAKHLYAIKNDFFKADRDFHEFSPVILTDNGGEFARVDNIEMDIRGELKLFFCDPNRSDQKARIEKNHTFLRDILPKGTSFDNLTQDDINLVCSHVNGVRRHALNGKSAYELFTFTYGKDIAILLGITKIDPEDVLQSPRLLDK
ncbi:TPA: IS30-like element ISSeq6 family transposase [Streptococcus equi subsp. zooepidemicus]|uniref:IS30-like element ISSeq6 family transposase n=1 Tax=Streptococcus equi TaxID=1336 RepID=UPI0005B705A9|nr:IS30-like element ISSeq6 family transposase [Streptococcus equi]KIQ76316.1 transposase [Streptococcus equi subsp. zooepidemicus]MCD3423155.1 IS30-like element ISSeq6 family transposase [Streptococcus equi subsp. zooepidemicus]MCD3423759.1 IS30-like element ISSeq6 family transposase [Streptococcus equi subsp. zooepidemicus]HEL0026912.1 IS30-like element ISSeq6 family transposase [Streptococcus equi subsp. zooepidemicus]HEL0734361.1 IS30-like element ISSeq6 family transposase [Streptococcus e